MTDWSQAEGKKCADCTCSEAWPGYTREQTLVCMHPGVLERTGGPRSCHAITRAPNTLCGPEGRLFRKRA